MEFHPSKVFSRPAESHFYAEAGRKSLIKRGLTSKTAPTGFETSGKWLGRAGIALLVLTEGYEIHGYATGRLSEREFLTTQSAVVVGGLGGWAGATGGAAAGALVPPPFDVVTIPAGALIFGIAGGFGGAKLGEMTAADFYNRLDATQKQQVQAFIYQQYGVAR